ncbi:MAG: AAA family ATPase [bacterium]|nr:AAA family ATPase [bacterium]
MANFQKIKYHNLRVEAAKLPTLVGRAPELDRLTRVIGRKINNNVLLVGPAGIGKTTLAYGWIQKLCRDAAYQHLQFIQFDTEHLYALCNADEGDNYYAEAFATLPPCILFIDNFGQTAHNSSNSVSRISRLYTTLFKKPDVRIVLTLQPHEYSWLAREHPSFTNSFETILLKSQPTQDYVRMLRSALPKLNQNKAVVPTTILEELVQYAERFPALGQLPRSAISLLDESLSATVAKQSRDLTSATVQSVIASKTGIPATQLKVDELENLKHLEKVLGERIIGQTAVIKKISIMLQRAKLGMRNPNKPLGSFLMLGPSGVGKTETAKLVAETMFGRSESFIRFDMSEFGQEHTVQRFIGSPAGYIGHESGGALTNALKNEPYSLILLDEIEKAHPKVFDIFLQVLDDGRLTSGQNETVDARHSIVMATSNVGVAEILRGLKEGADINSMEFLQTRIMPALTEIFRLEFLNRFDGILVFNPLTFEGLVQIAQLEIKKIEKRLSKHRVQFRIDPKVLESRIKSLADPRFGARPIKRFIEETCESLLVKSLLNTNQKV